MDTLRPLCARPWRTSRSRPPTSGITSCNSRITCKPNSMPRWASSLSSRCARRSYRARARTLDPIAHTAEQDPAIPESWDAERQGATPNQPQGGSGTLGQTGACRERCPLVTQLAPHSANKLSVALESRQGTAANIPLLPMGIAKHPTFPESLRRPRARTPGGRSQCGRGEGPPASGRGALPDPCGWVVRHRVPHEN